MTADNSYPYFLLESAADPYAEVDKVWPLIEGILNAANHRRAGDHGEASLLVAEVKAAIEQLTHAQAQDNLATALDLISWYLRPITEEEIAAAFARMQDGSAD